jgi:conjugal transfer mating pair stabilization protein TraN
MWYQMRKQLTLLLLFVCIGMNSNSLAGNRFPSNYPCSDAQKSCVSSGMRKVDGFDVSKDCWEYAYVKTCNYPSKNDCRLYEHCYAVANKECLLKDSLGNCVNLKREFSCKSWIETQKENIEARVDLVAKDGKEGLICKSVPCIDGNCVDKSYLTNGEMMDSVSKLYAASNMKPDKDHNFSLFAGFGNHCSKKPVGYSNCCPSTSKGWGKQLGVKCTKDEISLINLREKKLCVYVGKKTSGTQPFHVNKHYFCCFGNMLEKVIQVEGRKQLGLSFGSGGSPNCRGLTMEEIQRLDFSKIDFSEFINELMVKFTGTYKTPNPEEIGDTIKTHMNIKEYDGDENNPDNKFTGLNKNIKDDSWEAGEEKRIAAEKLELERIEAERKLLAKIEAERLEVERLANLERERLDKIRLEKERLDKIRLEKERLERIEKERMQIVNQKRLAKQKEIDATQKQHDYVWNRYNKLFWECPSHNDVRRIEWEKKWGGLCEDLGQSYDKEKYKLNILKEELARLR